RGAPKFGIAVCKSFEKESEQLSATCFAEHWSLLNRDYSLSLFNRFSITSICLDRNDLYARRSLTCCVFVSASIDLIVRLNVSDVFSRVSSIVAETFGPLSCTNLLVESTHVLLAEARSLRACSMSRRILSSAILTSRRT